MRAFAAVFAREIFERRFAFVVAFAAGFVPLIGSLAVRLVGARTRPRAASSWRSSGPRRSRPRSRSSSGQPSSPARPREKRISFFFSRPIPSAAHLERQAPRGDRRHARDGVPRVRARLALGHAARARALWGFDATPGNTALAALVLAVVLVLGSHAVVTVARLRSPWVALDLLLAPTLVFLAAIFLRFPRSRDGPLLRDLDVRDPVDAGHRARRGRPSSSASSSRRLVQVAEGRTDARRAHGAFSVVFFGDRRRRRGPARRLRGLVRLRRRRRTSRRSPAASRPRRAARGSSRGGPLRPGAAAARSSSTRPAAARFGSDGYGAVFSQDGSRAAWGEPRFGFFERKDERIDVFVADLATGRAIGDGARERPAGRASPSRRPAAGSRSATARRSPPTTSRTRRTRSSSRRFRLEDGRPRSRVRRRGHDPSLPEVLQRAPTARTSRRQPRNRRVLPAFEEIPRHRPLRPRDASLPAPERGRALSRREPGGPCRHDARPPAPCA